MGIGIIADAVLNHMADPKSNYDELRFGDLSILKKHPRWNNFSGQFDFTKLKTNKNQRINDQQRIESQNSLGLPLLFEL